MVTPQCLVMTLFIIEAIQVNITIRLTSALNRGGGLIICTSLYTIIRYVNVLYLYNKFELKRGGLIIHSGLIIRTKWCVNCFNRPCVACAFPIALYCTQSQNKLTCWYASNTVVITALSYCHSPVNCKLPQNSRGSRSTVRMPYHQLKSMLNSGHIQQYPRLL